MIHTPLIGRGGGERQFLKLSIELQKLGHEVEVFVNAVDKKACYPDMLDKVKANVIPHPLVRFKPLYTKVAKKRLPYYDATLPRMFNIARNIPSGFEIVNNHNFPTEWAAFFAKKRLRIPAVWMCNEPPFWFWQKEDIKKRSRINWPLCEFFDRISAKNMDAIAVLSRIAQKLVKKVYDIPSIVVRSGVDVEMLRSARGEEMRKTHGLEKDFLLLHVGNISSRGRQNDSIKALHYLSKTHDNVKLVIDGSGSRDALIQLSEKLKVRKKVLFLHSDSDEELAEVYAACDLFVFPSQITWGLAVVEAMAAGKPVIVSQEAGASEIIQTGVNGIIVENEKPEEIADRADLLMNDRKLRERMGETAQEYVTKNLSWEKYARTMESIFQRAILDHGKG